MHNLKLIIISIILFTLTSCGYIENSSIVSNRDREYLNAKSVPPLAIPSELSSSRIKAHYPVSEKDYPERMKKVDLTPPELN